MGAGGVHNLKHKELYERYNLQPSPKPKRQIFSARVIRYGYDKDSALTIGNMSGTKKRKTIQYDNNGRVCNKCKQYKCWDEFARSKIGLMQHTSICKICRNKAHQEYRDIGGREKDREYKHRKRYLTEGDQIYFNSEIREVQDYKSKKGYRVKSIVNGIERRISTSDNHYRRNNNCVRFTKLKTPVELVQPKEDNIPTIDIGLEPPKEEKKFSIDLDEMLYGEYE